MDGKASLEGLDIPLAELLAALRGGRRFIPVGDGQFAMISDQLRDRLTSIHDVSQNDSGTLKISRAAALIIEEALGDDISYESDQQWHDAIGRLNEVRNLQPVVPESLHATLRDYQKNRLRMVVSIKSLGTWGMPGRRHGSWKNSTRALGVLLDRAAQGPALIVAPTSVGMNGVEK